MKRLFAGSLSRKIFLIGWSCLILSLWIVTLVNTYTFKQSFIKAYESHAKAVSVQFQETIEEALDWGGDYKTIAREMTDIIGGMFFHPDFQGLFTQIAVADIEGTILSHNELSQINQTFSTKTLNKLRDIKTPVTIPSENSYDIYIPVIHKNDLKGYILIGFTAEQVDGRIREVVWDAIVITLVSLLLSALAFTFTVSRFVTDPLQHIMERIQHITKSGELSAKIEVQADDEIQELADLFNLMMDELARVDRLKDEFLANTSHELRTPLHGIIGISDSLLEGIGGSLSLVQAHNLRMIIQSAQRLSHLVNDLLDFSKIKHHEIQIHLEPVDLKMLVEGVLSLTTALIGKKDVEVESDIPYIPLPVLADELRLQQILYNLVGNAIKFTHKGSIRVSAQREGLSVRIAVSDTGIGIPKEQLDRIFKPFEQGDGSETRAYGGTGLGLSITRNLVELHGSSLKVESHVKQGSTFSFNLPLSNDPTVRFSTHRPILRSGFADADLKPLLPEEIPSTEGNLVSEGMLEPLPEKAHTILVVDDDAVNTQVLDNHLTLNGYKVLRAVDGIDAIQVVNQTPPDLIVLDLMMPRMSGYEVCQKLRLEYDLVTLPIILLTAKNQIDDLKQGFQSGANDYLLKPFDKEEFLARVQMHLRIKENDRLKKEILRRKAAEAELANSKSELEKSNASKDRLIAIISHDVGNLFNSLLLTAQTLSLDLKAFSEEELVYHLNEMHQKAQQISMLLSSLLQWAGHQMGRIQYRPKRGSLDKIIRRTLDLLTEHAHEKNINVSNVIPDTAIVYADPNMVRIVVHNLLSNAIKFTHSGGQVIVSAKDVEKCIEISVEDTGVGIEEEIIERLFDIDSGYTTKGTANESGNGLGLVLCKELVEKNGGQIWVNSQLGQHTRFTFTLPKPN